MFLYPSWIKKKKPHTSKSVSVMFNLSQDWQPWYYWSGDHLCYRRNIKVRLRSTSVVPCGYRDLKKNLVLKKKKSKEYMQDVASSSRYESSGIRIYRAGKNRFHEIVVHLENLVIMWKICYINQSEVIVKTVHLYIMEARITEAPCLVRHKWYRFYTKASWRSGWYFTL